MRGVVLFDLFDTLVSGRPAGGRTAVNRRIATVLGVDPDAFDRAFRATSRPRYVGTFGDLAGTIRAIAEQVGGTPSDVQIERAVQIWRAMIAGLLAAVSDCTVTTLARLREDGWRLGLVSNVTPGALDQWSDSVLSPYLDATAFSCELGVAKPDPGIYLAACRALSVRSADCVYVGDGADTELTAASALGMFAVRTTEHADSDPAWAGLVIGKLTELPAVLASRDSR